IQRVGVLSLAILLLIGGFGAALAQESVTVITTTLLRLRSGPGTTYSEIALLRAGTTLHAFARSADSAWLRVRYGSTAGWVAVRYLRVQGDWRALPVHSAADPISDGAAELPSQPKNGDLLGISLYAQTEATNYYRITYFSDGLRINGFLTEPRREGTFPALIYNRGGNRDVGALRGYEFIPFAEAGFVVVASQYRGGGGSEGFDNLGGADVNDVLNLIPLLQSRPNVDMDRIAMFGSSRGALMTYIALRRLGSAIKVAATTSGLADLFMWAKERPDLESGAYLELIGADTRSNPAAFRERSATYWAAEISTPLLLIHGDADTEVSVEQSRALFNRMRAAGRTVQLLIVAGGDHGLLNAEEGIPSALAWFARYLQRDGENFDYNLLRPAIDEARAIVRSALGY
ncbi:MAG: prolyl oligopeptidase family serine peptidase, partial [Chloroflexi bacterium]|nr:prolyl oligopeptidase family serine peptidase [Chloroflexota bacterium]